MILDLDQPHTCHVIVARDKNGFKRGFEKVAGSRIYLEYGEALDVLRSMDDYTQLRFGVEEAVIGYVRAAPAQAPMQPSEDIREALRQIAELPSGNAASDRRAMRALAINALAAAPEGLLPIPLAYQGKEKGAWLHGYACGLDARPASEDTKK